MTIQQALKNNPFNERIGDEKAYARYLRYNVDGFYHKTNKEVRSIWKKVMRSESD